VVWTAHPLSSFAVADRVYIDGILYHDREADARRITELEKEKAALIGAPQTPGGRRPEPLAAPVQSFEEWVADLEADVERFRGGPHVTDPAGHQAGAHAPRVQTTEGWTPPGSPNPNEVLAITNARIVTVTSKGTIERGTIVIRG